MIFDYLSDKFGTEASGIRALCPGPGFCERLEGAAGETLDEKFAEAKDGCPNRCQRLAKSIEEYKSDDGIAEEIERLVWERRTGNLERRGVEVWQWDLIVYFERIEKDFERKLQVQMLERFTQLKGLVF